MARLLVEHTTLSEIRALARQGGAAVCRSERPPSFLTKRLFPGAGLPNYHQSPRLAVTALHQRRNIPAGGLLQGTRNGSCRCDGQPDVRPGGYHARGSYRGAAGLEPGIRAQELGRNNSPN